VQLGTLGEVVFETSAEAVLTWVRWRETHEARYAAQDVIDESQILQFLGTNLVTIDLTVDLKRGLCDPEAELNRLKEMVLSGEAAPLVINGRFLGDFVVERAVCERRISDQRGRLITAQVDLSLREYK